MKRSSISAIRCLCDQCNEDYTNSDEQGGILFGSHAVCPKCEARVFDGAVKYGEVNEIRAHCPDGMSFKNWVLQLRGGDNTIRVQSWDN